MVRISFVLFLGDQNLPEEEELCDVQLPAVLLTVRHAGPAL